MQYEIPAFSLRSSFSHLLTSSCSIARFPYCVYVAYARLASSFAMYSLSLSAFRSLSARRHFNVLIRRWHLLLLFFFVCSSSCSSSSSSSTSIQSTVMHKEIHSIVLPMRLRSFENLLIYSVVIIPTKLRSLFTHMTIILAERATASNASLLSFIC